MSRKWFGTLVAFTGLVVSTPAIAQYFYQDPARFGFSDHALQAQIEGGYTVATGAAGDTLDNGWNAGLGLTWFPFSALPIGLRVDGSYSRFSDRNGSLDSGGGAQGSGVTVGHENIYGGDVDAELDLHMGPRVREYLVGGVGWYREQTVLEQGSYQQGYTCSAFSCGSGYSLAISSVQRSTTGWLRSWNAGIGFEFALENPASFFIEARYLRIGPSSRRMTFLPIRVGMRF